MNKLFGFNMSPKFQEALDKTFEKFNNMPADEIFALARKHMTENFPVDEEDLGVFQARLTDCKYLVIDAKRLVSKDNLESQKWHAYAQELFPAGKIVVNVDFNSIITRIIAAEFLIKWAWEIIPSSDKEESAVWHFTASKIINNSFQKVVNAAKSEEAPVSVPVLGWLVTGFGTKSIYLERPEWAYNEPDCVVTELGDVKLIKS